jgi:hypothetical protein
MVLVTLLFNLEDLQDSTLTGIFLSWEGSRLEVTTIHAP